MKRLINLIKKHQESKRIKKWIERRHEDYDKEIDGLRKDN